MPTAAFRPRPRRAVCERRKHIAVLATARRPLDRAGGREKCRIEAGLNLGNDHSDAVTFDKISAPVDQAGAERLRPDRADADGRRGALLQIAGALESMLDISVRYSNERVAFEKKISKFQAVQHNLAKLAGESAGARRRDFGRRHHRQQCFLQRRCRLPRSRQPPRSAVREAAEKGGAHRPSGARRDWLHHRAHHCIAITLRAAGVARRFRQRELLGRRSSASSSPARGADESVAAGGLALSHERNACIESRPIMTAALRFDPIRLAARMRGAAPGSARFHRRRNRRRHLRSARPNSDVGSHRAAEFQPPPRRARAGSA